MGKVIVIITMIVKEGFSVAPTIVPLGNLEKIAAVRYTMVKVFNALQLEIIRINANLNIPACGGTFTGDQGLFASPNYPSDYSNRMNCEWTIRYFLN